MDFRFIFGGTVGGTNSGISDIPGWPSVHDLVMVFREIGDIWVGFVCWRSRIPMEDKMKWVDASISSDAFSFPFSSLRSLKIKRISGAKMHPSFTISVFSDISKVCKMLVILSSLLISA